MTNQETTPLESIDFSKDIEWVPIRKRFDEEGRPSCIGGDYDDNCPFLDVHNDRGEFCPAIDDFPSNLHEDGRVAPGPNCPVHNPREDQEPR